MDNSEPQTDETEVMNGITVVIDDRWMVKA